MDLPGKLMFSEILETPDVLSRIIAAQLEIEKIADNALKTGFTNVQIVARGTSKNAGKYLASLIEIKLGIPASFASLSSVSIYKAELHFQNTLVIAISQSGESPDLIRYLEAVKATGTTSILLTNAFESSLSLEATYVISLLAGTELAVAATKSYTASLFVSYLLVCALGKSEPDLNLFIDSIKSLLNNYTYIEEFNSNVDVKIPITFLGRGYFRGPSDEVALKIQETSKVNIQSFSPAEYVHGPISSLKTGHQVVFLTSRSAPVSAIEELLPRIRSQEPKIMWVGENDLAIAGEHVLSYSDALSEDLSAISISIVIQLIAHGLAVQSGLNPDQPMGLLKITKTI